MKKIYKGASIEECLDKASKELNLTKNEMVYTSEEKKNFFKKEYIITVDVLEIEKINELDGTIAVLDGKVEITDPAEGGRAAKILPTDFMKIYVNNEEIVKPVEVFLSSTIVFVIEDKEAARSLDISISPDKMSAYISVSYISRIKFGINNSEKSNNLQLTRKIIEETPPPKYNIKEIKEELAKASVTYGIIEKNIAECVEKGDKHSTLIAVGEKPVNEVDDFIEYKFEIDKELKALAEDLEGNVDFKSIGSVASVLKDSVIAIRHHFNDGKDGVDITGNAIKHHTGKKINLKVSNGCTLKDENTVVAAISGKPCLKSGVFYIFNLHEIMHDVDISTGNVKFLGDIVIHGSVKEGMRIESGNSIEIDGDVERSEIKGKGDISIKGNIISSVIFGGGEDVVKLEKIRYLSELHENLINMIGAVEEIKKFNLLGYNATDGSIIKVLIESKFKNINKIYVNVVNDANKYKDDVSSNLVEIYKNKLLGLAPLNIKHYSEICEVAEFISNNLVVLKADLAIPVNIKVGYTQDSKISSSGDILFTGAGVYISEISANGNVNFSNDKCVVRGGSIKAENEIKCRIVGSEGGVATRLGVGNDGHIWIDTAYENTVLAVGTKEFVFDCFSTNVHAYNDKNFELIVDRTKK